MARIGKIARLPESVREELNKRLRSGSLGPQLLPWLNSLPEVRAVLEEHFGNQNINAENLSAWRQGGYADWEKKQDRHYQRIEHTRELAALSMKLAQAGGGNLTEGASAMVAGEILGVLEELEDLKAAAADKSESAADYKEKLAATSGAIESLSLAIARLRKGDQNKEALRQRDEQLKQKDEELKLAWEKHELLACEKFVEWHADKRANEIVTSDLPRAEQIKQLRQAMFGDLGRNPQPAA